MKLFLKRISIIAIILFLLLFIVEISIRLMNKDTYYSIKDDYMMENSINIKTLVLGSSHMANAINPICFSSQTYNLALPSQGIKVDYELLAGYMDGMDNLDNVIIDISYFSIRNLGFTSNDNNARYINYNLYMKPQLDCDYKYNFAISDFPYISKRLMSFGMHLYEKTSACDSLGWIAAGARRINDNWDLGAKNRVAAHSTDNKEYVEQNIGYLIKILELCNSRSIRLIAITPPAWHLYYDNFDTEQYLEIISIMQNLKEEYDFEYYNYLKDGRFVMDDFANIDHLSSTGANKFSEILANTLCL